MTTHLSPHEFTDAIEGTLTEARRGHLEQCSACGEEVAALTSLFETARDAADPSEPSPLFWEHFSRRVKAATSAAAEPAVRWFAPRALFGGWRLGLALGSMTAAVIVTSVMLSRQPAPQPAAVVANTVAPAVGAPASGDSASDDTESWNFMLLLASDMSSDELHRVAAPRPGDVDALADDLTPAQQTELVRLIKAEMGGAE